MEEGRGRLSTAQPVLLQGTVNSWRTNSSHSTTGTGSLHGTLPFSLLRLRKSSQMLFAALVDARTISSCSPQSMRWQRSFQKCWNTNQTSQGCFFERQSLHLHNAPEACAKISIPRTKISMTSGKPADGCDLDPTDKG